MPFAVEIFFDERSDLQIRSLWDALERAGITSRMKAGGYRPHVSLGVFDDYRAAEWETNFSRFVRDLPPFALRFHSIGIFPRPEGVVFFGAVLSDEFSSVHRTFHEQFAGSLRGSREYYHPGQWVPHCTLAIGLAAEEISAAVALCASEPLPLVANAREIGLVEFPGHREIATFPVRDEHFLHEVTKATE